MEETQPQSTPKKPTTKFICKWNKTENCPVVAETMKDIIEHQNSVHMKDVYYECWDSKTKTGCRKHFTRERYVDIHQATECEEISPIIKEQQIQLVQRRQKNRQNTNYTQRRKTFFAIQKKTT